MSAEGHPEVETPETAVGCRALGGKYPCAAAVVTGDGWHVCAVPVEADLFKVVQVVRDLKVESATGWRAQEAGTGFRMCRHIGPHRCICRIEWENTSA